MKLDFPPKVYPKMTQLEGLRVFKEEECYDEYIEPEVFSRFLSLDYKDLEESLDDALVI